MKIMGKRVLSSFGVAICCLVVPSLISCSSSGGVTGWYKFWDNGGSNERLTNKEAEHFVSNIRTTPKNADAYYQLGLYYQERSRHREAIAEFGKAVYADPASVKAHNALGVSYDKLGEYEHAVRSYEAALAIDPNADYVKNNLGYSYLLQKKPEKAIVSFKEALAHAGTGKAIHNNLGRAYAMNSQYEEALAEFKIAGGEEYAHVMLADHYYQKGKFEDAAQHYGTVAKADSRDESIKNRLAAATALARISQPAEIKPLIAPIESGHVITIRDTTPEQAASVVAGEAISSAIGKVKIEISNGNGVGRMAKRLSTHLKEKGINVTRLTNADTFRHETTRIYYLNGYEQAARELSMQLPAGRDTQKTNKLERRDIKIKVLMGRDMIPYNTHLK